MKQLAFTPAYGMANLKAALPEWLPVLAGLLALYVPTFYDLFNGLWASEEQIHGPIILSLALWLIYRQWPQLETCSAGRASSVAGWLLLAPGLVIYIVGRSQHLYLLEVGSFIWMLAAILLIKRGSNGLRVMWFPLVFMLFMVPLPGTLVILFTMPMKMAVSYVAEHLLYWANYPIARSGVILQIGQYQLLVADACAGLQTLLTLESLGLFYINITQHTSAFRNVMLALLIVPISFLANVIRITTLTLITYHFGDAAGQGFLHQFAGMILFLSALVLILAVDSLLRLIVELRQKKIALQGGRSS